jgi:hypothetical protein
MNEPKLFIGPMSKNIVDTVIDYCNNSVDNITIGLIPSRRQVENTGGYVNNWTTEEFCDYVKSKTDKVLLVRDHCGPMQGYTEDDGIESFKEDCKHFDIIHVDVWKAYPKYEDGLKATIDLINLGVEENPNVLYEVGTEESIRPFTTEELDTFLTDLKKGLSDTAFSKIKYAVIQSGTALQGNTNIGSFNQDRLIDMCKVAADHGLISKEHNGDYLEYNTLSTKFKNGLKSINVAPEFGQLETKVLYYIMNDEAKEKFYDICYESKRWVKWVSDDFKPEENKEEIVNICGHYVFSDPRFLELKNALNEDVDFFIKVTIDRKIFEMLKNSSWVRQRT